MKTALLLIPTLFFSATIAAQNDYSAASIPESLKKNAHSVKRDESILLDVKSVDKAVYSVHKVSNST